MHRLLILTTFIAAIICCIHTDASTSPHNPYPPSTEPSSVISSGSTSQLMHMWTTPLFVARPKMRDVELFNKGLSEKAVRMFDEWMKAENGGISKEEQYRGDASASLNEQFFQWQRTQHATGSMKADPAYRTLLKSPEFKALQQMFDTHITAYLKSIGKGEEWQKMNLKRSGTGATATTDHLFCWATIGSHGNYHLSHTHPQHMISGVYYSRIPLNSGNIVFDDPRGPRWPFDGRYIHEPTPGELILFPSWLVHQVTPTQGEEKRISWSCNVAGSWEDLADINLV